MKFIDKLFDGLLDSTKDKYFMMNNNDRRLLILKLKKNDERITGFFYFLLVGMFAVVGFSSWMNIAVMLQNTSPISFSPVFDFVVFAVALFAEVAWARTNSRLAIVVLCLTTILATIIAPIFLLVVLWALMFLPNWFKLQAMREVPGYPDFTTPVTSVNDLTFTPEQQVAFDRKKIKDLDDPEQSNKENNENLEKILNGEISLNDYLGVEKKEDSFDEVIKWRN